MEYNAAREYINWYIYTLLFSCSFFFSELSDAMMHTYFACPHIRIEMIFTRLGPLHPICRQSAMHITVSFFFKALSLGAGPFDHKKQHGRVSGSAKKEVKLKNAREFGTAVPRPPPTPPSFSSPRFGSEIYVPSALIFFSLPWYH